MNRSRPKAAAAGLALLMMPAAAALPVTPAAGAATALFAEGATRPSGEAQTGFGGAFCEQNTCRSLGRGTVTRKIVSQQIQTGVDATPGDLILVGYSVGGAGIYDRLREWERNPAIAPDPARIALIVTYGNPENKFGGDNRGYSGTGLPATQPYEHLDVTAQYDGVSDNPTRFGFYSYINSSALFGRHFAYFEDPDINDPDNLVYQEGNTTYMLIPAETLPMLQWLTPFVSSERLAELDARYRPLVEADYDRPAYVPQGEGADWGNGNPPPSLTPSVPQPLVVNDGTSTRTTLSVPENESELTRSATRKAVPFRADANAVDAQDAAEADAAEADAAKDLEAKDTGTVVDGTKDDGTVVDGGADSGVSRPADPSTENAGDADSGKDNGDGADGGASAAAA